MSDTTENTVVPFPGVGTYRQKKSVICLLISDKNGWKKFRVLASME